MVQVRWRLVGVHGGLIKQGVGEYAEIEKLGAGRSVATGGQQLFNFAAPGGVTRLACLDFKRRQAVFFGVSADRLMSAKSGTSGR